jgi:hypothetical protein
LSVKTGSYHEIARPTRKYGRISSDSPERRGSFRAAGEVNYEDLEREDLLAVLAFMHDLIWQVIRGVRG